MAGKAYLSQPRARDGKWTDGGVGKLISSGRRMGTVERGRTSAGHHGVIPVVVAEASAEDAPFRGALRTAAQRRAEYARKTSDIKTIGLQHERYRQGMMTNREKWDVEYASPQAREKAMRETGTYLRPKRAQVAMVRDRSKRSRDVTYNRLSGRYVAARSHAAAEVAREERLGAPDGRGGRPVVSQRRPGRTGAALRAKLATPSQPARKAPRGKLAPTPEYVGRRRAAT
jgi:hypothetical protein